MSNPDACLLDSLQKIPRRSPICRQQRIMVWCIVLAGCGKTHFLHAAPRSGHVACWYQDSTQDAQKGHPARPQRVKRRIVLLSYVEPLNEARTPLVDFFRILLDLSASMDILGNVHRNWTDTAGRQFLVSHATNLFSSTIPVRTGPNPVLLTQSITSFYSEGPQDHPGSVPVRLHSKPARNRPPTSS